MKNDLSRQLTKVITKGSMVRGAGGWERCEIGPSRRNRISVFRIPPSRPSSSFGGSRPDLGRASLDSKLAARPVQSFRCLYNPRSKFDIVVFRPFAITCNVMSPASRLPRSMSEMWPRLRSRWTARSVWVRPFRIRRRLMRAPSFTRSAWLPLDTRSSSAYYSNRVSGMPDIALDARHQTIP